MARGTRGGRKTDYTWQGQCAGVALVSGGAAIVEITTPSTASTLTRTRGRVRASIDGPVANDKSCVGVGLIAVTEEQLAVGITAIPSPIDDFDAEWFWHGVLLLLAQGASTDEPGITDTIEIDSKAMRRMKQTQTALAVIEARSQAGTPAVDVMITLRSLFGI